MNTCRLRTTNRERALITHLRRSTVALVASVAVLAASKTYGQQFTIDVGNNITLLFFGQGQTVAGYTQHTTGTQNWTQEQVAAVVRSAQMWDNIIENTSARRVTIAILWDSTLDEDTNGSTGNITTTFNNTLVTNAELVWRHNQNIPPATGADARIAMNPDRDWVFGVARPDADEQDFASTVVHEIGHALGFITNAHADANGNYDGFNDPLTSFDQHLEDIHGHTPQPGVNAADPNQMVGTGSPGTVFWTGPEGNNRFGGQIPIATFDDWEPGSSLRHTLLPETLMHHSRGTGTMSRALLPHEVGMLMDLGWAVNNDYLNSYAGAGTQTIKPTPSMAHTLRIYTQETRCFSMATTIPSHSRLMAPLQSPVTSAMASA